ncbi:MAG: hypothetical protein NVS3B10_12920 [Polyangiales bacterium]
MHQASCAKLFPIGAGALAAFGLAALIGCAVGSDPGADVSQLDSLSAEAGPAVDSAATTLPPSNARSVDDMTADDAGDAGGGGATDASTGTDAAVGMDSGGGGGGGGTTSCTSPNTCAGATDLGSISGDTGADTKTATGSGSQWFKIRVNENDNGITGVPMHAKAELVSPLGTNFDLFLYLAGGSSGQECSAVKSSSTNASGPDTTTAEWGETGLFSNGVDDSRTVSVEVRWISGPCSAASKWTLTVTGDTP